MAEKIIPLVQLKKGQHGIIRALMKNDDSVQLMEMGLLPGEEIVLERVAPLGDPISVRIGNMLLSLRKEQARMVLVEP